MLEKKVIDARGFRLLDATELDSVSGGQDETTTITVTADRPDDPWVTSVSPDDLALFGNFLSGINFDLGDTIGVYGPPAEGTTSAPDPDEDYSLPEAEQPTVPPSEIEELIDNVADIVAIEDGYFLVEFRDGSRVGFNSDGGVRVIYPY